MSKAKVKDKNGVVVGFDEVRRQIEVEYGDYPSIWLDIPIDANGNYPTLAALLQYVTEHRPKLLIEKYEKKQIPPGNIQIIRDLVAANVKAV